MFSKSHPYVKNTSKAEKVSVKKQLEVLERKAIRDELRVWAKKNIQGKTFSTSNLHMRKNVIQINIDLINKDKNKPYKTGIRYRAELTEGFNITPNFFNYIMLSFHKFLYLKKHLLYYVQNQKSFY